MKRVAGFTCLLLVATASVAQNVPPPPKPDPGPSLEVTLKYIEDRLNAINFTYLAALGSGASYNVQVRVPKTWVNNVQGQTCNLAWTLNATSRPSGASQNNMGGSYFYGWWLSLANARAVTVQAASDRDRQQGVDQEVHPNFYYLTIKMQSGKAAHVHLNGGPGKEDVPDHPDISRSAPDVIAAYLNSHDQFPAIQLDTSEAVLLLPDEESANRLAKAFVHAIDLCDGGDNDPFK